MLVPAASLSCAVAQHTCCLIDKWLACGGQSAGLPLCREGTKHSITSKLMLGLCSHTPSVELASVTCLHQVAGSTRTGQDPDNCMRKATLFTSSSSSSSAASSMKPAPRFLRLVPPLALPLPLLLALLGPAPPPSLYSSSEDASSSASSSKSWSSSDISSGSLGLAMLSAQWSAFVLNGAGTH